LVINKQLVLGGAVIVACLLVFKFPALRDGLHELQDERQMSRGRELANVYCSTCHLEPPPDILPKKSWEAALGYMGYMLGMENLDYLADHPEFAQENVKSKRTYLLTEHMIPDATVLSESEWDALRFYYVESATSEPLPQADKPKLHWDLPQFDIVQSNYRADPPVTTMVHIREETSEAYIGDSLAHTLAVLGSDGQLTAEPRRFGPAMSPVGIEFLGDAAYVASIGDICPDRAGTIDQHTLTITVLAV